MKHQGGQKWLRLGRELSLEMFVVPVLSFVEILSLHDPGCQFSCQTGALAGELPARRVNVVKDY